jgi:hypothetical protein
MVDKAKSIFISTVIVIIHEVALLEIVGYRWLRVRRHLQSISADFSWANTSATSIPWLESCSTGENQ